MSDNFNISTYLESINNDDVILFFEGELTQSVLNTILQVTEQKLYTSTFNVAAKKRVINVLIECMQNIYHHDESFKDTTVEDHDAPEGMILITKTKVGFSIITKNAIYNGNRTLLEDRIESVNSMEMKDIKDYYKKVLETGKMSAKGGGGLGIIDIAKRSGEKLEYSFEPCDDEKSFFILKVKVNL